MDLKVALVQTDIIWEDVQANLVTYSSLFRKIDKESALIVLPEMFNTGFSMNVSLAESMHGPTMDWMRKVAIEKEVGIIGSLMIRDEADQVFNRLVYCSNKGEIQTYDKRHLFRMAEENKYFSEGQENIIVEINGFKIRPLVCYDLRFPVWSRNNYIDGEYEYDCLLYIANWPSVRSVVWKTLLRARAMENISYVIGVNRIGEDGNGIPYIGDTMASDAFGQIIGSASEHSEEVLYVTLDMTDLNEKRKKFPVGLDADGYSLH